MVANHEKPRWSFYPIWIILTLLCIPMAFFIDLAIMRIIVSLVGDYIDVNGVRHITEDYLAMYAFIPIAGLLTGTVQFGLLRRYLPRIGGWVLATTAGWLLGALLIVLSGRLDWMDASFNLDVAFILMGLAIGVGQWPLLRRRFPRAGWWIAANVVGWGLSGLITPGNALGQFGLFTLGVLPACVTAAALAVLIINQAEPAQPAGIPTG
jgi:hypothetical protein